MNSWRKWWFSFWSTLKCTCILTNPSYGWYSSEQAGNILSISICGYPGPVYRSEGPQGTQPHRAPGLHPQKIPGKLIHLIFYILYIKVFLFFCLGHFATFFCLYRQVKFLLFCIRSVLDVFVTEYEVPFLNLNIFTNNYTESTSLFY